MQILTLGEMPWKPEFMEPCYEKANLYKDSLQGLKERFGFHGVASLVLRAQNLMQQVSGDTLREQTGVRQPLSGDEGKGQCIHSLSVQL